MLSCITINFLTAFSVLHLILQLWPWKKIRKKLGLILWPIPPLILRPFLSMVHWLALLTDTHAWPHGRCWRWRCRWWAETATKWTGRSNGNFSFQHSFQPMDSDDQNGLCAREREREKNNTVNVKQIKNIIMNWLAHRSLFKCSLQPINRGKTP